MRVFEWAGVALSSAGDESLRFFNLSRINNAAFSKARGSGEDLIKDLDIQPRVRARKGPMLGSDAKKDEGERCRCIAPPITAARLLICYSSSFMRI